MMTSNSTNFRVVMLVMSFLSISHLGPTIITMIMIMMARGTD